MTVYVETSALLAVLFNEPSAAAVVQVLNQADVVVTSVLTFIEAKRASSRFPQKLAVSGILENLSINWNRIPVDESIQKLAGDPFPIEPVRTLDAIHLASALEMLKIYPDLAMLSLDKRILDNLEPLGLVRAELLKTQTDSAKENAVKLHNKHLDLNINLKTSRERGEQ